MRYMLPTRTHVPDSDLNESVDRRSHRFIAVAASPNFLTSLDTTVD
jgi:hypothetical protein